ncbi:MAG: hypothetical protein P4L45_06740 [Ignavibacteriaceae bacterium]|nr:hypothetical protein [Ignavibacteriaceae bacterium]
MKINTIIKSKLIKLPKVHEKVRIKGFAERYSACNIKNIPGRTGAGNKNNPINDTRLLETAFKQAMPGIEKRINILGIS